MNGSRKHQGKQSRTVAAIGVAAGMVVLFTTLGGAGLAQNTASASESQYGKKVTLCHKGKKTISVGKAAVPAHLRHGDTVGPCTSAAAKAKKAKQKAAKLKAAKSKSDRARPDKGKPDTPHPGKGERK